jgi:hypothetical protein
LRLKHNPIFQRHKEQIAEAIEKSPAISQKSGQYLFDQVLIAATELDRMFEPDFEGGISPQIMTVKRDEFQKKCRDLGEWLTEYAPNLVLTWD